MSTHALASLTATYTDSEPEGEEEDRVLQDEKADKSSEGSVSPGVTSVEAARPPEPSRVATLVSYHDDAADEEEEDGEQRADSPPAGIMTVELPPEPTGRVSPKMLEKVSRLHERMEAGLDMNMLIQNRKEFRNPSIYEKLIQFCGINELGTNYPAKVYDPLKWGKESFYEELARVQKTEMDKREKEKKDKTKVEFVMGTKKGSGVAEDDSKKRKSKWDQVGSGAGGLLRPSGLLQPASLTTSASGTKSTVISAFGSLPKKPKA